MTAAIYSARSGLEPLLIEGPQPGGQLMLTTDIENFPGFQKSISGMSLIDEMHKQAEHHGTKFMQGVVVKAELKENNNVVILDSGERLESMTLIVATGASARYLGIESEQKLMGRGVSACAVCDGAFYRNMRVAVIGGGDTAIEEATYLTRFASEVIIVHRRDQFRASKVMAERALANKKISVVWDSVVEEVLDVSKNEVTGLRLKNVKTGAKSILPVQGMFLGIGHQPNSGPFKDQLNCNENGYVITNNTRTNIASVFAAGDIQDPVYRQAITAAGSGCMASLEVAKYLEQLGL